MGERSKEEGGGRRMERSRKGGRSEKILIENIFQSKIYRGNYHIANLKS